MQLFIIMAKLRLVFLAVSYHISIAAVIRAKPVFSVYNELISLVYRNRMWAAAAAGVICLSEKPVCLFFCTPPSCLCHVTVQHMYLNSVHMFDCHKKNKKFIVFSVSEPLRCVHCWGDASSAAGPLLTLKGSSMILFSGEGLNLFFYLTLQNEVKSPLMSWSGNLNT